MSTLAEKTLKAREKHLSYLKNLDEKQCAAQIINNIAEDFLGTYLHNEAEKGRCEVPLFVDAHAIADCSNKMNNRQFANKTFTEVQNQLQKKYGINRLQYGVNVPPDGSLHIINIGWCDKYPETNMLKKFWQNFRQ